MTIPAPPAAAGGATAGGSPAAAPTSAAAVMGLVEDQLSEERSLKSSLEARAIGVITSSGALATLLLALAALVTRPAAYELPDLARVALAVTLAAFTSAVVLAIFAARPGTYFQVLTESLRAAASESAMARPAQEGDVAIAAVLIDVIEGGRQANRRKAGFLKAAVTAEAVAAVLLAAVVGIVLLVG